MVSPSTDTVHTTDHADHDGTGHAHADACHADAGHDGTAHDGTAHGADHGHAVRAVAADASPRSARARVSDNPIRDSYLMAIDHGYVSVASTVGEDEQQDYSDLANAKRFANMWSTKARWCDPWRCWLIWDGRHWLRDRTGAIRRLARGVLRFLIHRAADCTDPKIQRCMLEAAKSIASKKRMDAMLAEARAEAGVPVLPEQLDAQPMSFNVLNGTIDLATGQLRPHCAADLITALCPVAYHPNAKAPLFVQYLAEVSNRTAALSAFVQRFVGYALTGTVTDHVLPILYGPGANGKTTLIEVLLAVFGPDYSMTTPSDLLMAKGPSHPTEKADLFGKRLVICDESEEGRRFSEATVKSLTGGGSIRARRCHENSFEFPATYKLLMSTNHRPTITGRDHAIWRRIRLIPFDVTVAADKQDKHLKAKLLREAPGILAWAVRGCLDYQRQGLGCPPEVTRATDDYRQDQDQLMSFLAACCCRGSSNYRVKAGVFFRAYLAWCKANGTAQALNQTTMGTAVRALEDVQVDDTGRAVWYVGLAVQDEYLDRQDRAKDQDRETTPPRETTPWD